MNKNKSKEPRILGTLVILMLVFALPSRATSLPDESLTLAIQPIYGMEKTREAFQPLADYLSSITGKPIRIHTYPNFIAYWEETRKGHTYDLILDAAHFTGYRARTMGFDILAKVPGTVSYSVIAPDTSLIIDIEELVGKKIASLGPPSMGAAKVSLLFDNPLRQPFIYEAENTEQALDLLYSGEVDAAIIPTPMVSTLDSISVITTTEPSQHMALSASPRVSEDIRAYIGDALIHASSTTQGKAMLEKIGFPGFEHPMADHYLAAANLLQLAGID